MANVKVFGRTYRQTDGRTDGQLKNYMLPFGGIQKTYYGNVLYRSPEITRYYWDKSSAKFNEDWKINVATRVLTRFYYSHIRKNVLPLGSHVFQANIIIFELIQNIIETNLLTKLHEDWTIYVASRVLTRFYYSHIESYKEKCAAPAGHVSEATKIIFELIQDIIGTNLLTKFHDDRKINVTSRALTRKNASPPWWPCFSTNRHHF
ncbi:hypothetical protein DPMN_162688 [Dreissena polymorpha]|uniref:Uncharacterized protein n=1 Tax=Dreissena polymorpha TaxID=45954 RepID=A0A9D4ESS7_DREPO|nr:hypothetical protein DPMN_162688 [Dreissena polymorpha]